MAEAMSDSGVEDAGVTQRQCGGAQRKLGESRAASHVPRT